MSGQSLLTHIPNALTAKTLNGLRRSMFLNNIKYRAYHRYFDIQFVNGKWYAFYIREDDRIEDAFKGGSE